MRGRHRIGGIDKNPVLIGIAVILKQLHVNAIALWKAAAVEGHGGSRSVVHVDSFGLADARHHAEGSVVVGYNPPLIVQRVVVEILRDGLNSVRF